MSAALVQGRSCGTCTLCCRVMEIRALEKAQGVWCPNCDPGVRCRIYADRPGECANFYCGYLTIQSVGEEWRPERSRIVLAVEEGGKRLAAHVDLKTPNAWRQEPFHSKLRQWSAASMPAGRLVVVRLGVRMWVVLPDREIDLGDMTEQDRIVTTVEKTPAGPRWDAYRLSPGEAPL